MSNTNLPPNTNGLVTALETLNESINKVVKSNTKTLEDLNASLVSWGNITTRLKDSFSRADKTQVKALATGTTLAKFTSENTEILKTMRGDFFENATELLKNFEEGIREDSKEVVKLTNIMRSTGQNTDLMRSVMSDLLSITGNSIDSLDTLARVNEEVSRKALISNEKLLNIVKDLSSTMKRVELVRGAGTQLGVFSQKLAEVLGVAGSENIKPVVDLLISADQRQARMLLGLQDAQFSLLQGTLSLDEFRGSINQAYERIFDLVGDMTDNMSFDRMQDVLARIGNPDQLSALIFMKRSMDNQVKISDSTRRTSEEAFQNQRDIEGIAREFYNQTLNTFYPTILNAIPGILAAGQALNVGALFKGLAGGGVGNIAKILGVYGLGFTLGSFLLPELGKLFAKPNKAQEQSAKSLASLDRKTPSSSSQKPERQFSINSIIAENLKKGLLNSEASRRDSSRANDRVITLLEELIKVSKNSGKTSRPNIESGQGL